MNPADPTIPRYQQLKAHIIGRIQTGGLRPRDRVPSEQDLVREFGVSRMTANRALRELAKDGYVTRQTGVGTFVAEVQARSHPLKVRNIADEIRERGHMHSARVISTEKTHADADIASRLRLRPGAAVFHSLIIHYENDLPVQAEDRYVCAHSVPGYLAQDFTTMTPNEYLSRVAPLQTVEHVIRAELPGDALRELLRMEKGEPCLVIYRRTWSAGRPVSVARLYHAGPRYELTAGFHPGEADAGGLPLENTYPGENVAVNKQGTRHSDRIIRAPRGTTLSARSWLTEAPLRMLMNNLDPEVAEHPEELVVYGGIGRAARNWECFDRIVATLKDLAADETLLIQSGKPVGVFRTHADAPRVLLANSNLVPHWATWEHFNELDRKGLMMYGQMTAGSWIYIGSQGIVQGTYETFAEMARQHFGGDQTGSKAGSKWILTAGLGGMGGAQPLAATMAGISMLVVECQSDRIDKRLATGYLDRRTSDLAEALAIIRQGIADRKPVSVGLLGNAAEVLPELIRLGIRPDAVTDQTSAHDPVHGYLPMGWTVERWLAGQNSDPAGVAAAARASIAGHVRAMLAFQAAGVPVVDYGNNIRQVALDEGVENAFDFPGFVPAYIRPLFCQGIGPFRWVALSGDPEDIYATDRKVKELLPDDANLHNWLDMARERIQFQGLPARICWVGLGDRHRLGLAFNEMVRTGELKAPVVIGRDHLDSGSVASPNRETEAMQDGSDAVSDWPILNALLNTASGATWVSLHHGGGVGMGYSQHAGVVIVCDGTEAAARRIGRVLWNDPATGVMRHADAGYETAVERAVRCGLNLPMIERATGRNDR